MRALQVLGLLLLAVAAAVDRSPYREACRKLLRNLDKETSPAGWWLFPAMCLKCNAAFSVMGSSITYAASHNCPAVIKMLLEKDLSLASFAEAQGRTALVFAAEASSMEALQQLMTHVTESDKNAALIAATIQRQLKAVERLLENGATVDARDSLNGATSLMHAARKGDHSIVEMLLTAGANASLAINSDQERTAMDYAVMNDDAAMTLMLIKKSSTAHENIVLRAALRGSLQTFKACVKAGFSVNVHNHNGATPLLLAASQNYSLIVEEALRRNAPVDAKMKNGVTALIAAARGKCFFYRTGY